MPGYETKQECIDIQGAAPLQIRSLLDRQQHADPFGEAELLGISSAAWPLFGLLWESSRQLAAVMAVRPLVPHERVLEVGCGLALASLVCHRRGQDVTASDCHPLASSFLVENLRLNILPPMAYRHGHWADAADLPARPGHPIVEGRYGLVIGSDVLYERDDAGHLCGFINRHVLPTAEVLIVDPNRGNRAAFTRCMERAGFVLQRTRLGEPRREPRGYSGWLLSYRRREGAVEACYR